MKAYDILKKHGVTRLCHFTKLQTLTHILQTPEGILATAQISKDLLCPIDSVRADGELDYVCCSIEYPNSWYLKTARDRNVDNIFREWAIMYISPRILNVRKVKVSECNAARNNGQYILEGNEINTEHLFAKQVASFKYKRPDNMLSSCPTNGQAEILIKNGIPREYIIGIAVGNKMTAQTVYAMQKTLGISKINIYISPQVLNNDWSNMVRAGIRPVEINYIE